MLLPDLTYNVLLATVELSALAFCLTQRRRTRPLTVLLILLLISAPAALVLAWFVNELFGFRMFGILRFVGHAGAIHLPLLLVVFSVVYRRERRLGRLTGALAIVLLAGAVYAYHIEPYRLEVTGFSVTSPRLRGLERPIRILQVADIQTDRVGPYERRVVEEMKRLDPDLILYLGDYIQISDPERREEVAAALNQLLRDSGLNPPWGSFAVQGDCEDWSGWASVFRGTGVEVLHNEVRTLELPGLKVNLVALDNENSRLESLDKLRLIAGEGESASFEIFAGHSPDFSDQLTGGDQPFLALAGHTHGGQVRIPFWGAPITYSRLPRGMVDAFERFGPGVLSVSRGIGMERHEAPRVRFLCRPELRMVTLLPPGEAGTDMPGTIRIPDPDFQVAAR